MGALGGGILMGVVCVLMAGAGIVTLRTARSRRWAVPRVWGTLAACAAPFVLILILGALGGFR